MYWGTTEPDPRKRKAVPLLGNSGRSGEKSEVCTVKDAPKTVAEAVGRRTASGVGGAGSHLFRTLMMSDKGIPRATKEYRANLRTRWIRNRAREEYGALKLEIRAADKFEFECPALQSAASAFVEDETLFGNGAEVPDVFRVLGTNPKVPPSSGNPKRPRIGDDRISAGKQGRNQVGYSSWEGKGWGPKGSGRGQWSNRGAHPFC